MKTRIIKSLNSICSGQTVLALFISCLILWLYILPTAHQHALGQTGSYLSWLSNIHSFNQTTVLNQEYRNLYAFTEFTAGLFEDLILFALILSFQSYVQSKSKISSKKLTNYIIISTSGFIADILQSMGIIYFMVYPTNSIALIIVVNILMALKVAIYLFVIINTIIIWKLSRK